MKWAREIYYRLPPSLHRAIITRRSSPAWKDAGIIFIHIPKAAGTSISNAIYGRFLGHVRGRDIERWGSAGVRALPSFAVTRNPWGRLVSAFRYGRRLHTQDWSLNTSVPRSVRRQVPQYVDFGSFVTEWLQQHDVTKLNPIYQPQSLFVCDRRGSVLVDHVGRVEDLAPTYEFLGRHGHQIAAIDHSNRSGERVDYRSFYTPELLDIVGRIYADDVERFGYSFERD
jgi:hypothetical protein